MKKKKKSTMRKAHRAAVGGAMTMNVLPLMSPGTTATTAMGAATGGIGIGVTGIISDKMFDLTENKKRRNENMPLRDGTGPRSQGPRTGRGLGNCKTSKRR